MYYLGTIIIENGGRITEEERERERERERQRKEEDEQKGRIIRRAIRRRKET